MRCKGQRSKANAAAHIRKANRSLKLKNKKIQKMTKKNYLQITLMVLVVLTISSCAPKGHTSDEYGFFSGIWHGICFPFALLGKLFSFKIGLYAENNSGFFYWLGFILGLGGLGGGGARSRY